MALKAPQFSGSGTFTTLEVDETTIVVDEDNNRVGIGTATPSSTLEIESSSGDLVLEMDNNASNSANFQIQNGAGNSRVDFVTNGLDGGNPASLVNTTITMKAQKVGIMDTSPSYTLDVTGDIRATGSLYLGSTAVTSSAAELNKVDGATAGTVVASKAVCVDVNKDITGFRNVTLTGELDAATLDISGDADIDGTLEADAITVDGVALAEVIADTVGAMVGSNTETNVTVTYEDSDNTLDFVVGTLNQDTSGTAAIATTVTCADESSDTTCFVGYVTAATGDLGIKTGSNLTFNSSNGTLGATEFSGGGVGITGLNGTQVTSGTVAAARVATLNQDTTGTAAIATTVTVADESSDTSCNVLFTTAATGDLPPKSGTNLTFNSSDGTLTATNLAGTLTTAAQTNITSVGTIGTGTWQGTAVASAYLDADTAHLSGTQTFTGAKTFSADVVISGATPQLTIGDAGAEDTFLVFDGNAQDYRIGINDGTDTLEIGLGAAHGTTPVIKIDSATNCQIMHNSAVADGQFSGDLVVFQAGEDLTAGEVVYFKSDGKCWKAVATAEATARCVAMATATISANAMGVFLLKGFARFNSEFPQMTVGGALYTPEAETANASNVNVNVPEQAAPDTDGDFVQVLGFAISADAIYFDPDSTVVEVA